MLADHTCFKNLDSFFCHDVLLEGAMNFESDIKYDFKDVLIRPKRSTLSSRQQVVLEREFTFRNGRKAAWVPILAANMDTVGTAEMAHVFQKHQLSVALHKHYSVQKLVEFFSVRENALAHWYSMGISEQDLCKFNDVMGQVAGKVEYPPNICIDVANGYQESLVRFIQKFRDRNPDAIIMAGNVVTGEMTEALLLAGADVIKVGIGPGSVCTTRLQTGVGYPQLSAIIECADAAHGLKGYICADGGLVVPGDFGKAFGGGADFCMAGGVFSGHDESGGELVNQDGRVYHKYYGMSSEEAMSKHHGGVANYRSAEGRSVLVPHKGPVENTIKDILGGLRSTCTYVGAERLKELPKRTTFVRVTQQYNAVFEGNQKCQA